MSARLFHIDSVIVGRFNPYIITPDWLRREGIIESASVEMMFGVSGRGEVAFQFKTEEFDWRVDYGRLIIGTNRPSADPAAKAARVMEKLPHTPVSAFGNNFRFKAPLQVWSADLPGLGKTLDFRSLANEGTVQEVAWSCKIKRDGDLILGITVEQTVEEVRVNMNFHRNIAGKDQAIVAAKSFPEDRKASREVMVNLIREKVDE